MEVGSRRLLWVVPVALLAALLMVVAIGLQPFIRAQTRKELDRLVGTRAVFSDARVGLFPLRYRITHLKVRERDPKTNEPVFYADELAITLRWSRLLTGRLVGTVEGSGVKVVMHQPREGTEVRLPPVEKVIPVRAELEWAHVAAGEVLYAWVYMKDQPSIWFHDIEGRLSDVPSRPDMAQGPFHLFARGKVQRSGRMTVSVTADPYVTPLGFSGTAKVQDFDLSEMNALLAEAKGVKLSSGGRFDMEMQFECRRGLLRGWIDPRVRGVEVKPADESLGSAFKAMLTKISMRVSSPTEGTQPSGRIEVTDDLTGPKRQLWPSLEKVVENGLLIGIEESLKREAGGNKKVDPEKQQEKTPLKTGE